MRIPALALIGLLLAGCVQPDHPLPPASPCQGAAWSGAVASPKTVSASEVSLAVDPTDPLHVVAAANSGGGFGIYTSLDGGATWTAQLVKSMDLFGPQGAAFLSLSDPSVAFSPDGTAHVAGLAYIPLSAVFVASQRHAGDPWTATRAWTSEPGATSNDKEWLGVDPVTGTMVLAWQREPALDQLRTVDTTSKSATDVDLGLIVVSRSTDGGATWSLPATVSTSLHNNGTQVAFLDGVAHLVWVDYEQPALVESVSHDLGQTWSAPRTIAPISIGHAFQGFTRMHTLPGLAVGADRLAVTWHDSRNDGADVYVLLGNATGWGQPERVPDDALGSGRLQLYPWDAIDAQGRLHVTYASGDPALFTFRHIARATNGTWSAPTDLSPPFRVFANATKGAADIGDYTGAAFGGGHLYAAWAQPQMNGSAIHVASQLPASAAACT